MVTLILYKIIYSLVNVRATNIFNMQMHWSHWIFFLSFVLHVIYLIQDFSSLNSLFRFYILSLSLFIFCRMSLNNETQTLNNTSSVNTITVFLNLAQQKFATQLSLVIIILGLIGFLGNIFTFLQPTLRKNSFCIYTLCGSLSDVINMLANLMPSYVNSAGTILDGMNSVRFLCKLKLFAVVFLPQLSMNLLIMPLIDRYACTYGPTSQMCRLLQLRMVPWLVGITVAISFVVSLFSPILYDIVPGVGCSATHSLIYSIFYILIQGILTPLVMIVIVLLTYRRFKQSRQRVVSVFLILCHWLKKIFASF